MWVVFFLGVVVKLIMVFFGFGVRIREVIVEVFFLCYGIVFVKELFRVEGVEDFDYSVYFFIFFEVDVFFF